MLTTINTIKKTTGGKLHQTLRIEPDQGFTLPCSEALCNCVMRKHSIFSVHVNGEPWNLHTRPLNHFCCRFDVYISLAELTQNLELSGVLVSSPDKPA